MSAIDGKFSSDFFHMAPDLMCIAGTDGVFKEVNPVFESMLGYTQKELTSRKFFDFIHPDDHEATQRELKKIVEGEQALNFKNRYRTKGGTFIWLSWNAHVDQHTGLIYATAREVTEQVKTKRKLLDTKQQLEQANEDLEAFSYSVSHDLRTPLRAITGFSQILLEDHAGQLDQEGQRLLQVVIDNTDKMGDLIDDILTYSRVSRAEPVRSRVDLQKIFEDAASQVLDSFPELKDKTTVTIQDLPPSMGDLSMLKQVAVNLISNAVKYSTNSDPIEVEVGVTNGQNPTTYYVKDNGIGFDMQYVDKLFGVFQRLHNSREYEGTGVGLSLVKRIIDSHGGDIWVESEPNEGTTFYFQLSKN
ncbi:ATP-binding protein [Aliifodinibius sp. S!AR15-10]|uniref:ATP-binding protein n=1 Tax=Aliifodinibius sp. S!AR15-10 TaxID=2950437 RepID=UPI00286224CE|nr:ATP-binding protein [Aliifodinibius sp. S!AR15-10]MDR8390434.1 ATP-binding protein [Aliifodinibius sp. S!AR15-10]